MKSILGKLQNGSLQEIGTEAEKGLADEIVRLFTLSLPGATVREFNGREPQPRLVQRAENWLENHPNRIPRIDELSGDLNVSSRQLYRAFNAEVGMSPAKYLRRYRLTRARLKLLDADPVESTVTSVAYSLGFWELGRFSVDYRRLFGESPSKTLSTFK